MKRIGILTASGDTPALNATLYGAVTRANQCKMEVDGFIKGFSSLLNPRMPHVHLNPLFTTIPELDRTQGGTMLGASRDYVDPTDRKAIEEIADRLQRLQIEGLRCTPPAGPAAGGEQNCGISDPVLGKLLEIESIHFSAFCRRCLLLPLRSPRRELPLAMIPTVRARLCLMCGLAGRIMGIDLQVLASHFSRAGRLPACHREPAFGPGPGSAGTVAAAAPDRRRLSHRCRAVRLVTPGVGAGIRDVPVIGCLTCSKFGS